MPDKEKVRVMVQVFGRATPVVLDYTQRGEGLRGALEAARRWQRRVVAIVKLQCPAGAANPSPPVGPALGQHGVNIMEFCKAFNARTQDKQGLIIPAVITVYADRTFTFELKTPPAAVLLKRAAKIEKGSGEPNRNKVGKVTQSAGARDRASSSCPT